MARTRILGAALVVGIAILAAGCGSDDDSQASDPTQWADGVCTAISTWQHDMTEAADTLKSDPSSNGFNQAAEEARASTTTLVETVQGLGAPDTDSGEKARTTVETLTNEFQSGVDTVQGAIDDADGVQGLLNSVSTVTAEISKMTSQLSSSLNDLSSLGQVDDELRQAFDDASSCDGLIPASS